MSKDPILHVVYAYATKPAAEFDSIRTNLSRNGIEAQASKITELGEGTDSITDVILCEGRRDILQELYPLVSARGIPLIAVVGDSMVGQELSSCTPDAYCQLSQSAEFLSVLIRCVFRRRQEQNELSQKYSELEKKLEETQLIGQAKSLLSRQLQISEVESFRRLRAESRRSQRKLADVARCLVDAQQILKSIEVDSKNSKNSQKE